jgi:hypothetical protein
MASRAKRGSSKARARPRRWLALGLGLLIVAGALYVLVRGRDERPLGEIDAASRAQLERVLEQAEAESGGR